MGRAGTELPIFDLRNTSPEQTPERASGSTLCANTELGTWSHNAAVAVLPCGDRRGPCATLSH
jgi:hypothetical protein